MNEPLLRDIQRAILDAPPQFDMVDWSRFVRDPADDYGPICGTTHCIGGLAVALTGTSDRASEVGWAQAAADVLALYRATPLFFVGCWPDRFRARYRDAASGVTRAQVAAEVIDDFIATHGWGTAA